MTPWTSCQSIAGPHRKQPSTLTLPPANNLECEIETDMCFQKVGHFLKRLFTVTVCASVYGTKWFENGLNIPIRQKRIGSQL